MEVIMKILRKLVMLLALPLTWALAHSQWGHMMDWGHMNYWSGGAIVFVILLLGLIGVAVYFVINQKKMGKNYRKYENDTLLEILKERYAKGEITKAQFEDMKETLL
jgi:putative membrane protein